ncbi:MAG: phage tail sheath subtilisin-like domain-containing protein, partial [Thalassolituus sp.]
SISGSDVITALYSMFDTAAMSPGPMSVEGARYLITLSGGADGIAPVAVNYGGVADEVNGSTGFTAFEDVEDISIVMCPAASADATNHQAIVAEMQKHCRKMRYRVGIVDAREGMSLSEVREFRSNFDDSRLALYYPWVVAADPRGVKPTINLPPAGFIAGVYANTDVQRGVHKAPANEPVIGALGFTQEINQFQQELLNPAGVNCLRSFAGRGHRVWGGRTLSSDPEWKYVNVRRYFLYLERSIEKSTQWVVFEPNGERLWDNVRITIENFLYNEWSNGRLLGTAKSAYFVRCDRSTMTQNDLDNGRLVCEVGVAALKPAEFVIFRIGQKTADS